MMQQIPKVQLRRKTRPTPMKTPSGLKLDQVLGITNKNNSSLCIHPTKDIVAYPAGSTVVIFQYKKNKQGPFLIAKPELVKQYELSIPVNNLSNQNGMLNKPDKLIGSTSSTGPTMPKTISCLCFSSDGRYLAVGETGHCPRVIVWDIDTQQIVSILAGHKLGVRSTTFTPNMKYLITLGFQHDGFINVWNWRTGSLIANNRVTSQVNAISISHDSSYFITVGLRHIKYWYFPTNSDKINSTILNGRAIVLGKHRSENFVDVTCHPSDHQIYALSQSGILCSINESRQIDKHLNLKMTKSSSLDVSDKFVICGGNNGSIWLFNCQTLEYIGSIPKPHHLGIDLISCTSSTYKAPNENDQQFPSVISLKTDKPGNRMVVTYQDNSLYIWDTSDIKKIGKVRSCLYHSDSVWYTHRIPDSDYLPESSFASCSSDGTVRIWNLESSGQKNIYSKELIQMLYVDSTQSLQDTDSITPSPSMNTPKKGVRTIKVTADCRYLISGDRSGNLKIYDLSTFKLVSYQEAHDGEILDLDVLTILTDEGSMYTLATASRDRLIHVFSMTPDSFRLVQTLDDHSSSVTSVRFFDDGTKLVSGSADKSVIFRSTAEKVGLPYFSPYHHYYGKATIYDMASDHFGGIVATVSQDKRLTQFQVETGRSIKCFKPEVNDEFSPPPSLTKVDLDLSGCFACIGGTDRCVRLLDLNNNTIVATMMGHSEMITSVKFNHDCTKIISSSGDGCIFVWKIAPNFSKMMRHPITKLPSPLNSVFSLKQTLSNVKNGSVNDLNHPTAICNIPEESNPLSPKLTRPRTQTWSIRSPSSPMISQIVKLSNGSSPDDDDDEPGEVNNNDEDGEPEKEAEEFDSGEDVNQADETVYFDALDQRSKSPKFELNTDQSSSDSLTSDQPEEEDEQDETTPIPPSVPSTELQYSDEDHEKQFEMYLQSVESSISVHRRSHSTKFLSLISNQSMRSLSTMGSPNFISHDSNSGWKNSSKGSLRSSSTSSSTSSFAPIHHPTKNSIRKSRSSLSLTPKSGPRVIPASPKNPQARMVYSRHNVNHSPRPRSGLFGSALMDEPSFSRPVSIAIHDHPNFGDDMMVMSPRNSQQLDLTNCASLTSPLPATLELVETMSPMLSEVKSADQLLNNLIYLNKLMSQACSDYHRLLNSGQLTTDLDLVQLEMLGLRNTIHEVLPPIEHSGSPTESQMQSNEETTRVMLEKYSDRLMDMVQRKLDQKLI